MFSIPNVEKVVYPPQNPVMKNHLILEFTKSFFSNKAIAIPIKKQPRILMNRIPRGYSAGIYLIKNSLIKYLVMDPSDPPMPIKNEPYKTHLAYVKERRTEAESKKILEDALSRLRGED